MNERRASLRHLVRLNVDLYHDDIGHIGGNINDVSSGGMSVNLSENADISGDLRDEVIIVKPANMDVLFNMRCLRADDDFISLIFME